MNELNETNGVITPNNDNDLKIPQNDASIAGAVSESNENEEDVTTRILQFLSTASNETFSGIALGLGLSTYVLLGRLGLVLLGALGGVVLHATWEGKSSRAGA